MQHSVNGSRKVIEETTAVVLALEPEVMVACTRVVAVEMENTAEINDMFWKYN